MDDELDDDSVASTVTDENELFVLQEIDENSQSSTTSSLSKLDTANLERRLRYLPVVLKQNAELRTLWDCEKQVNETLMEELTLARQELEEYELSQESSAVWEDVVAFALLLYQKRSVKEISSLVEEKLDGGVLETVSSSRLISCHDDVISEECKFAMESGQSFEKDHEIYIPIKSAVEDMQDTLELKSVLQIKSEGLFDPPKEVLSYIVKHLGIVLSYCIIDELKTETLETVEKTLSQYRNELTHTDEVVDRFLHALEEGSKRFVKSNNTSIKPFIGHVENTIRTCLGVNSVKLVSNPNDFSADLVISSDYVYEGSAFILSKATASFSEREIRLAKTLSKHIFITFSLSYNFEMMKTEISNQQAQLTEALHKLKGESTKNEVLRGADRQRRATCVLLSWLIQSQGIEEMTHEFSVKCLEIFDYPSKTTATLVSGKAISDDGNVPLYVATSGRVHNGRIDGLETLCVPVSSSTPTVVLATRSEHNFSPLEVELVCQVCDCITGRLAELTNQKSLNACITQLQDDLENSRISSKESESSINKAYSKYESLRNLSHRLSNHSLYLTRNDTPLEYEIELLCHEIVSIMEQTLQDTSFAAVCLVNQQTIQLFRPNTPTQTLQLGIGLPGRVISTGVPTRLNRDQIHETKMLTELDLATTTAMICVPVMAKASVKPTSVAASALGVRPGVLGCLYATGTTTTDFNEFDESLLECIGFHLTAIITSLRQSFSVKTNLALSQGKVYELERVAKVVPSLINATNVEELTTVVRSLGLEFCQSSREGAVSIVGSGGKILGWLRKPSSFDQSDLVYDIITSCMPVALEVLFNKTTLKVSYQEMEKELLSLQRSKSDDEEGIRIRDQLILAINTLYSISTESESSKLASTIQLFLGESYKVTLYGVKEAIPPHLAQVRAERQLVNLPACSAVPLGDDGMVLCIEFDPRHTKPVGSSSLLSSQELTQLTHFAEAYSNYHDVKMLIENNVQEMSEKGVAFLQLAEAKEKLEVAYRTLEASIVSHTNLFSLFLDGPTSTPIEIDDNLPPCLTEFLEVVNGIIVNWKARIEALLNQNTENEGTMSLLQRDFQASQSKLRQAESRLESYHEILTSNTVLLCGSNERTRKDDICSAACDLAIRSCDAEGAALVLDDEFSDAIALLPNSFEMGKVVPLQDDNIMTGFIEKVFGNRRVKSMICSPVLDTFSNTVGLLCVISNKPDQFKGHDMLFCKHLCSNIHNTLQIHYRLVDLLDKSVALEREVASKDEKIRAALQAQNSLVQQSSLSISLFQLLIQSIPLILQLDLVESSMELSTLIHEHELGRMLCKHLNTEEIRFYQVVDDQLVSGASDAAKTCSFGQGLVGTCALNMNLVYLKADVGKDERFYLPVDGKSTGKVPKRMLCLPILTFTGKHRKQLVGVLVLFEPEDSLVNYVTSMEENAICQLVSSMFMVLRERNNAWRSSLKKSQELEDIKSLVDTKEDELRFLQNQVNSLTNDARKMETLSSAIIFGLGCCEMEFEVFAWKICEKTMDLFCNNLDQVQLVVVKSGAEFTLTSLKQKSTRKSIEIPEIVCTALTDDKVIVSDDSCRSIYIPVFEAVLIVSRPLSEPLTTWECDVVAKHICQTAFAITFREVFQRQALRTEMGSLKSNLENQKKSEAVLSGRVDSITTQLTKLVQKNHMYMELNKIHNVLLKKCLEDGLHGLVLQSQSCMPKFFAQCFAVQLEKARLYVLTPENKLCTWDLDDSKREIAACNMIEYVVSTGDLVRSPTRLTLPIAADEKRSTGCLDLSGQDLDRLDTAVIQCLTSICFRCISCATQHEELKKEQNVVRGLEKQSEEKLLELQEELVKLANDKEAAKKNGESSLTEVLKTLASFSRCSTNFLRSSRSCSSELYDSLARLLEELVGSPVRFIPVNDVLREPVGGQTDEIFLPVNSNETTIGFLSCKKKVHGLESILDIVGDLIHLTHSATSTKAELDLKSEEVIVMSGQLDDDRTVRNKLESNYYFEKKLNAVARVVSHCETVNDIMQVVSEHGLSCVLEENRTGLSELVLCEQDDDEDDEGLFRKFDSGLSGMVVNSGHAICVGDLRNDLRFHSTFDGCVIDGIACNGFFCGPVLDRRLGKAIALVRVWCSEKIEDTDLLTEYRQRLCSLCDIVSSGVVRVERIKALEEQNGALLSENSEMENELDDTVSSMKEFQVISILQSRISDFVVRNLSIQDTGLKELCERVRCFVVELLDVQSCALLFVGDGNISTFIGSGSLTFVKVDSSGKLVTDNNAQCGNENWISNEVTSIVISKQPYIVSIQDGGMQFPYIDDCRWVSSSVVVPCTSGEQKKVYGLLQAVNKKTGDTVVDFVEQDLELLSFFADHVGACLERVEKNEQMTKSRDDAYRYTTKLKSRLGKLESLCLHRNQTLKQKIEQQRQALLSKESNDDTIKMLSDKCESLEEERSNLETKLENKTGELRRALVAKTAAQDLASRAEEEIRSLRKRLTTVQAEQSSIEENASRTRDGARDLERELARRERELARREEELQAMQREIRDRSDLLLRRERETNGTRMGTSALTFASSSGGLGELRGVCDQMRSSQQKRADALKKLIRLEKKEIGRGNSSARTGVKLQSIETVPWSTVKRASLSASYKTT